ncbi:MAG: redox-regulated ATPase YchF [Oscillospiraceae bacterium]|nr:redox-regulated ATPase YchF [Oscillospiraceae bacterium]
MKLGIVGLPNVGKSTLFNAISNAGAQAANYPFCTIEPNVGTVAVPDERLDWLAEYYSPKKYTPATIEFVDIAGLVRGASKGEGLGNKFLENIRQCDAIIHVVRCFDSTEIIHVEGSVDPVRDIETVNYELLLSDIEILSRRIEKTSKALKGDKKLASEYDFLERLNAFLNEGNNARAFEVTESERAIFDDIPLLSAKPVIYAANISEDDLMDGTEENEYVSQVRQYAEKDGSRVVVICAKTEEEIAAFEPDEKKEFLEELGIKHSGLEQLIQEGYSLLGLISFLTGGADEVRAWTIKDGTKAPQAAGKIHSDFERGFIRAEIVPFETLKELGSMQACREKGLIRSEGKDYVMKDGDVTLFRFNV